MKKKFILLISGPLAALALMTVSCGKDDSDTPDPSGGTDAPSAVTVSPASIEAPQAGSTASLSITAPSKPKFSVVPEGWITFTDGTFSGYKETVTVTVAANDTYSERTAVITFTSGTLSAAVQVKQAGKMQTPDPQPGANAAWQMAEKLGFGWNMGNQLEAFYDGTAVEDAWTHTLATQETFTGLAEKGVKSVRIPVSWIGHIGAAPEYIIDDRLDRVAEVVGYAKNAGLNVLINIHHDGSVDYDSSTGTTVSNGFLSIYEALNSEERNEEIKAEIKAVWTQIAERFKDEGDYLIFESFNEIQDGQWGWSASYQSAEGRKRQNEILHEWNQVFVDAVRATGSGNAARWLGVPGYAASPEFTLESFELPEDPAGKLMVTVHEYTPYHFAQTAVSPAWGHTRKNDLDDETYNEDYMRDIFSQLHSRWVANGVPVYLGEFGCANRSDAKEREFQLYYLRYLTKCAKVYGMAGFIWDNGAEGNGSEIYGIVHHGTGEYLDEEYGSAVFEACKEGFLNEDENYTLQRVYDSAPE